LIKIGILGETAAVGVTLAKRLAQVAHDICIGSRDPSKAQAYACALRVNTPDYRVSGSGISEAASFSKIVFLTSETVA
jgi:predicted dinucleotide-binding enzyme